MHSASARVYPLSVLCEVLVSPTWAMIFDREAVQSANCREFVGSNSSFNAQLAQVDGLLPVGTETFAPLALGLDFCELEPSEWRGCIQATQLTLFGQY